MLVSTAVESKVWKVSFFMYSGVKWQQHAVTCDADNLRIIKMYFDENSFSWERAHTLSGKSCGEDRIQWSLLHITVMQITFVQMSQFFDSEIFIL